MNEITKKIKEIIIKNIPKLKTNMDQMDDNMDLFALGMDSLSSIKIVVQIELEFDIEFSDEDLNFETLHTINNLCQYVQKRMNNTNDES